jgi:hypothetical protein
MSKVSRRWWLAVLCLLAFLSVAARPAYGENEGSIRGAAFLDMNRNGMRDEGEKGVGWVYFTISQGDYSHTYHSEWQTVDSAGREHATGTFGPAPLKSGTWTVTFNVPEGYAATTPVQQNVYVPSKGIGEVYLGLYPGAGTVSGASVLPESGFEHVWLLIAMVAVTTVGGTSAFALGLAHRRRA